LGFLFHFSISELASTARDHYVQEKKGKLGNQVPKKALSLKLNFALAAFGCLQDFLNMRQTTLSVGL
jgi:hypothetical protein